MTRTLAGLAAAGSLAVLLGAFGFQYLGGLAPCHLCLLQRWPHGAALAVGLVMLWWPWRPLAYVGGAAALVTAGIGLYHTGVERDWWQGPSTCTSSATAGLSTDELMAQIMNAPLVRCDDVAWSLAGLSMASWNAVLSLGLVALWLAAARR